MVNGKCYINHVHTFLHVVQHNELTILDLLTYSIVLTCIKTHVLFYSIPYLTNHYRMNILSLEYNQNPQDKKLFRVKGYLLGYITKWMQESGIPEINATYVVKEGTINKLAKLDKICQHDVH